MRSVIPLAVGCVSVMVLAATIVSCDPQAAPYPTHTEITHHHHYHAPAGTSGGTTRRTAPRRPAKAKAGVPRSSTSVRKTTR